MTTTLTVVRYPRFFGWAGFMSMAIFRFPLLFNRSIAFWKLLGCGKNGTFDKSPDWRQWAVLLIHREQPGVPPEAPLFFTAWWNFFNCEKWTLTMDAIEGHGLWDGKAVFGPLAKQTDYAGPIGILTRATIRLSKLRDFWSNVDAVASGMAKSAGFVTSVGIGEVPFIKQATFSIWTSKEAMRSFAYQMKEHAEVIRKTKKEDWYSEEMFVRFKILGSTGSINGNNPFEIKP